MLNATSRFGVLARDGFAVMRFTQAALFTRAPAVESVSGIRNTSTAAEARDVAVRELVVVSIRQPSHCRGNALYAPATSSPWCCGACNCDALPAVVGP